MKTLYISDLDGTLLQPDVTLSVNTITILNELIDRGVLFSVATARSIASVRHILKDVKISVPIILMNGVCVYDLSKDEYIKIETFPQKSIDALIEVIESNRLKGFVYTIKNGVMSTYYEDLNSKALYDFYKERVDLYQKKFTQVDRFSSLSKEPIIYFSLMDHKEALEPIHAILQTIPDLNCTFYKDNYSPDFWYLEIFNKTASKYHAVKYLRDYLGIDHIVCFGDNRNDLPLFEAGDYKIAVGNAVSELQEKADLIIGKNTDDGVAAWLKEHVKSL
ncbi:MAG TPA: HAD family hydrolase [Mobilitalea sp.]|nr:HAD family hydrolase [Mobilitalea sp.]